MEPFSDNDQAWLYTWLFIAEKELVTIKKDPD
jgi:hypothetical protein